MKYIWDSGATNGMIKMKYTKSYDWNMCFNKVGYITNTTLSWKSHDVKGKICVLDFSISKIISHWFHIDNDEGDPRIEYDMILGRHIMVQLGIKADFNYLGEISSNNKIAKYVALPMYLK